MPELETPTETGSIVVASPIGQHPAIEEAIEIFILNDRDTSIVDSFFKNQYGIRYPKKDLTSYFDSIDQSITKEDIEKYRYLKKIKKESVEFEQNAAQHLTMTQQMIWQRMYDLFYAIKDKQAISREDVANHAKQSQELCALSKDFRETYKLRLEMIGMGKTEEEAKSEMEAYVASMLKQAMGVLDEHPDAQDKLSEFLNFDLSSKK